MPLKIEEDAGGRGAVVGRVVVTEDHDPVSGDVMAEGQHEKLKSQLSDKETGTMNLSRGQINRKLEDDLHTPYRARPAQELEDVDFVFTALGIYLCGRGSATIALPGLGLMHIKPASREHDHSGSDPGGPPRILFTGDWTQGLFRNTKQHFTPLRRSPTESPGWDPPRRARGGGGKINFVRLYHRRLETVARPAEMVGRGGATSRTGILGVVPIEEDAGGVAGTTTEAAEEAEQEAEEPWAEEAEQPWAEEAEQPWAEEADEQPWAEEAEQPWAEEAEQPGAEEAEQPGAEEAEQPCAEESSSHKFSPHERQTIDAAADRLIERRKRSTPWIYTVPGWRELDPLQEEVADHQEEITAEFEPGPQKDVSGFSQSGEAKPGEVVGAPLAPLALDREWATSSSPEDSVQGTTDGATNVLSLASSGLLSRSEGTPIPEIEAIMSDSEQAETSIVLASPRGSSELDAPSAMSSVKTPLEWVTPSPSEEVSSDLSSRSAPPERPDEGAAATSLSSSSARRSMEGRQYVV